MCRMSISEDNRSHVRNMHEAQQEKIDALIAQEEDGKARLTLMVMSSINKSISANTELTYAVHKEVRGLKIELENHIEETEAAKNQGKGILKVMQVLIPALWIGMGSAVGILYRSYDSFQIETATSLTNISEKLQGIETRMTFYGLTETPLRDPLKSYPKVK